MSEEQIQQITKLLENDNPALRQLALEKLIPYTNHDSAIDILIQSLNDKDTDVRSYAAEILGQVDFTKSSVALAKGLEDENWKVRAAALASFGKHANPETVRFLIFGLRDEHPQVRFTAARDLKNFDDISIIEPLFETLKDSSESVREEAKTTLLQFPIKVPASLIARFILDSNKIVKEVVVEFLTYRVEGNPVPHLKKAYNDEDWQIRLLVLQELRKLIDLGEISDPYLYEINLQALDDTNPRVRFEAISNIGVLKEPQAIEILGEIARNDE
ncbi:HEAT repeat domain-containing protein, partial [Candidatus Heimdallarchaeota archaeon]